MRGVRRFSATTRLRPAARLRRHHCPAWRLVKSLRCGGVAEGGAVSAAKLHWPGLRAGTARGRRACRRFAARRRRARAHAFCHPHSTRLRWHLESLATGASPSANSSAPWRSMEPHGRQNSRAPVAAVAGSRLRRLSSPQRGQAPAESICPGRSSPSVQTAWLSLTGLFPAPRQRPAVPASLRGSLASAASFSPWRGSPGALDPPSRAAPASRSGGSAGAAASRAATATRSRS